MVRLRKKHVPLRRCIICREQRPKSELVRVVRTPDGTIEVDVEPKAPGRGAYICRAAECVREAVGGRRISRSLQQPLPEAARERLTALAKALSSGESEDGP